MKLVDSCFTEPLAKFLLTKINFFFFFLGLNSRFYVTVIRKIEIIIFWNWSLSEGQQWKGYTDVTWDLEKLCLVMFLQHRVNQFLSIWCLCFHCWVRSNATWWSGFLCAMWLFGALHKPYRSQLLFPNCNLCPEKISFFAINIQALFVWITNRIKSKMFCW